MEERKRPVFPYYYAPGKRLVHIVARISNQPGSLSEILELLASRVDLIGTSTYLTNEGNAIFSGFAVVLSPGDKPNDLKKLVQSSPKTIEARVDEGQDGVLVDSFHLGIGIGGRSFMRFRREGLSKVFDKVVEMLESGGETLLHEEGSALGKDNAKTVIKLIGAEMAVEKTQDLRLVLRAMGWGMISVPEVDPDARGVVQVKDCFECGGGSKVRQGCHFFRGYLEGYGSTLYGLDVGSEETKCILRGDAVCEFVLKPKGSPAA